MNKNSGIQRNIKATWINLSRFKSRHFVYEKVLGDPLSDSEARLFINIQAFEKAIKSRLFHGNAEG